MTNTIDTQNSPPTQLVGVNVLVATKQIVSDVVRRVLQEGVHYGTIPGTKNPTLYKPGAEALFCALGVAPMLEVEDLSLDPRDEVRIRVLSSAVFRNTGITLAQGVGECSSDEERYKWRSAVCDEEYEETSPELRRIKYKNKRGGGFYTVKQIRTNPSDLANTILKMAKKRSLVDLALTVSAASDTFTQDIEDLPDYAQDEIKKKGYSKPRESKPSPPVSDVSVPDLFGEIDKSLFQEAASKWHDKGHISGKQEGRLFAIARSNGWEETEVRECVKLFVDMDVSDIPWGGPYDAIVSIFEECSPRRAGA